MKKLMLSLVVGLSMAVPVMAQTTTTVLVPVQIEAVPVLIEMGTISSAQQPSMVVATTEPVFYASGPYFIAQLGAYGAEDTQRFNGYELDSEASFRLNIGYKINPMWAVQGEIGYFGTHGNGYQFNATPLAVAVRLGLPAGAFEPYILAGGGAYFCKTMIGSGSEAIDEVVLGGYLGAGVLLHAFGKMLVGGELRYQFLDIYSGTAPNSGIEALFSVGYQY